MFPVFPQLNPVYCAKCGSYLGWIAHNIAPKIDKVRFFIDEELIAEYPIISKSSECPSCKNTTIRELYRKAQPNYGSVEHSIKKAI